MKSTYQLGIAVIFVALCGVWFVFAKNDSPLSLAQQIVNACAGASDHAACYEQEVPALYPKESVPQLFDIVRAIRTDDPTYQFCHVLGHKIGERVVAEDPNNWMNLMSLNPADMLCSNGYIHGVIGGRFRAEVLTPATIETLIPDFAQACAPRLGWSPSNFERATCYHGTGHLFDFITNANIPAALSLCSRTAPDEYQRVCVQGVFMQIYQPLEPDDFQLIAQMSDKPSTTTVRTYCAQFKNTPMYQGSCMEESWPYVTKNILNGTEVANFCTGYPNKEEEDNCYSSMAAIIGRLHLGEPSLIVSACLALPEVRQGICFAGAAQAVLQESLTSGATAITLCSRAPAEPQVECYSTLADHAWFHFGDTLERKNFCAMLPDTYQPTCLAR